jgi:WD40 repeat protein
MDTRARTNPFPGLRPFMQEEADLFFGRDGQSDDLVRRLAGRRFLAAVGTSGSGKSSLVRAGLLPSLEGGFMAGAGAHWRIAILRPQDDPIGFLARAMVETGALAHLDLAPPAAEGVVETTLRRSSLGLVEVARLARLEPHENLLIVVDQFEELFRFADLARQRGAGDEAPAFVKLLLEAARQTDVPVYVVITMRSDFLGDCARFRDLPEAISDCQYLIPRLTRDELQAVITGPIGVRGGRIAPSLVQHLLNDVGDDMDQLPLLQHALMRAWDHWERSDRDGRPIELSDLEAVGGMAQALSRHADEAFGSLVTDRDHKIAERLFKCLTERGPDNREVRRPTQLSRIAAIANANPAEVIQVIDVFRAPGRSFLMPPHGVSLEGDSVIDISHESLIRQWGRLRTWVEEEAESRATYLRLVEAAQLHRAGKAGLWGEPDLTYARQWQEREAPNATWAERYGAGFEDASAFLRDSEAANAAELEQERRRAEAERMAQERELEQAKALAEAQRQRADAQLAARIRQRRLTWGLASLFVLALGAAGFALWQRHAAEGSRKVALSRELAARAILQLPMDPELSVLLAREAAKVSPTDQAGEVLRQSLLASPVRALFRSRRGPLYTAAYSPGGNLVLASGRETPSDEKQTAFVWETSTGKSVSFGAGELRNAALSPDGRLVFGQSSDGVARVWDARTREPRVTLRGHSGDVSYAVFSPDGESIFVADSDKTARLWNTATGEKRPDVWHTGIVTSAAYSPDGSLVVTAGQDNTARVWKAGTPEPIRELPHRLGNVTTVAFSRNGRFLVTASGSGPFESGLFDATWVWDVRSWEGKPLRAPDRVYGVAFSPDSKLLATAHGDSVVRVWDPEIGTVRHELRGHTSWAWSVAFSPDGNLLVTTGAHDGTARVWSTSTGDTLYVLRGHTDFVRSGVFSPDGASILTVSDDHTARIWTVGAGRSLETLPQKTENLLRASYSHDGRFVAGTGAANTAWVWDVVTGRRVAELPTRARVVSAAFNPNDTLLVAACEDGRAWLWDWKAAKAIREPFAHSGKLWGAVFSHDGKLVLTADQDGTARVWNLDSGKPVRTLRGHGRAVTSATFSPDDKLVVTASEDNVVNLWDPHSGGPVVRPLRPLTKHSQGVYSAAFDRDGRRIVTAAGSENLARISDASTGHELLALRGHTSYVWSAAFSPNGRFVVTASWDQTARVWDGNTGTELTVLRGNVAEVSSAAFDPDGKHILTASKDGAMRIYEFEVGGSIEELMALADKRVTRALTADERSKFLHERPKK